MLRPLDRTPSYEMDHQPARSPRSASEIALAENYTITAEQIDIGGFCNLMRAWHANARAEQVQLAAEERRRLKRRRAFPTKIEAVS